MWRVINHVSISSQKPPDTLIIPHSCVFSHNNLALSCKDSPACDLCVCVKGRAEEGEPEHGHTAADAVACFLLPAIFHPGVYVISVHFLPLFPPLCLPKQASIYCSILMLAKEDRSRKCPFSGQFSYQYATVYCIAKTIKFTPRKLQ